MVEDINDTEVLMKLKMKGGKEQLDPAVMEIKDTCMWNPLQFATYQGHSDVVKYLANEVKIDIGLTAPKNLAINEGEQVNNQEFFIEDTVFVLQMALIRENNEILSFLLDRYSQFWPKSLFDDWFKDKLF